jgi:hypothetical protein
MGVGNYAAGWVLRCEGWGGECEKRPAKSAQNGAEKPSGVPGEKIYNADGAEKLAKSMISGLSVMGERHCGPAVDFLETDLLEQKSDVRRPVQHSR